jgi:hypothetical protein
MGFGGRWSVRVVLLLGALCFAVEARAGDGGPLLVFDPSAEALPQGEIRAAVERELGQPLAASSDAASGELSVAVDAQRRLVVRYRSRSGTVERVLPMPSEPSDVPLIISLAAGNLARDQTGAAEQPKPVEAAPAAATAQKSPPKAAEAREDVRNDAVPPKAPPGFRRHQLGIHVGQDVAIVGGSNVCDANLGQKVDNYACFYEGSTDEPFWHTPFPYKDGIETGPVLATTRLLVSYDYAVGPSLTFGGRFGYAFRGGPPAGQEPKGPVPDNNLNFLPAHAKGTGGVSFMPVHAELRAAFWFLPLGAKVVSAYVGSGFGLAQVDAKTTIAERDCAQTLNNAGWEPATDGTFDDCRLGRSNFNWQKLPETRIDAWKKMGQAFVTVTFGALFPVDDLGGVVLNVNAMYMLPASGIVFEPSLGAVAAF